MINNNIVTKFEFLSHIKGITHDYNCFGDSGRLIFEFICNDLDRYNSFSEDITIILRDELEVLFKLLGIYEEYECYFFWIKLKYF